VDGVGLLVFLFLDGFAGLWLSSTSLVTKEGVEAVGSVAEGSFTVGSSTEGCPKGVFAGCSGLKGEEVGSLVGS